MDWQMLVTVGSALVAVGVAGAASRRRPSGRHTALPPPSSSAPAAVSAAELDALKERVHDLEARVERLEARERDAANAAGTFRTQVLVMLARIGERLGLKDLDAGGTRESSG